MEEVIRLMLWCDSFSEVQWTVLQNKLFERNRLPTILFNHFLFQQQKLPQLQKQIIMTYLINKLEHLALDSVKQNRSEPTSLINFPTIIINHISQLLNKEDRSSFCIINRTI
eukprot:262575_1